MCAGKGLGGGVAIAALFGTKKLMEAWRAHVSPTGEAPHASTYYAHPLACAGAYATVGRLATPGFRKQVERLGERLFARLEEIARRHAVVGDVRSVGLLAAVELVQDRGTREPAPEALRRLLPSLLARGILALPGGLHNNVLMLLPPLNIAEEQLALGLDVVESALATLARS
jgi:4-aminobutyrate aminotransferase/(S)-3-amino-2-methylpropionate transaminase